MDKQILVSVAIPFYNQERFIAETLTSVLNQKTKFAYEIVCGDDCSTDGSRHVLAEFKRLYPDRIRVIYNEKNLGLMLNIKNIYDNCKGKYIAPLGGDDLFLSEYKLQKQYEFLEENTDHGLVYSDAKLLLHNGIKPGVVINSANIYYKRQPKSGYVFDDCLIKFFIIPSTTLFRKDLYERYVNLAFYHSIGIQAEDFPLYLDLSSHSKFGYLDEPLSTYRITQGTISRPNNRNKFYAFYDSCFSGRLYFTNKYSCSEDTKRKFLKKYHLFYLMYAFDYKSRERAEKSFSYLSKNGYANTIVHLHYWGVRVWPLRIVIKALRRVFKNLQLDFW